MMIFVSIGALPACAFWELDDWSARNGIVDAADGSVGDGGSGDGANAKSDANYCATIADSSVFCDDFDTDANPWTEAVSCPSCTSFVLSPDAGNEPSPPNVLYFNSHAGDPDPSNYRLKTFNGSFTSMTSDFWAYVDSADTNGQAALEQLVYTVDGNDYIRVRVYVNNDIVTLQTAVDATSLSNTSFDVVSSTAFALHTWHHVNFALLTTGGAHQVTWTVDGAVITPPTAIQDADRVPGPATRIDLQCGVFYVGNEPTTGITYSSFDNVTLSVP
jgi:hypothetical protein